MTAPFDQQVTFLYAEAPEACWHFYEEVLGLPLAQDQGACRIYGVAPGSRAFLGVCRARGPRRSADPRAEGGAIVTFVVQDAEAWQARLKAKGIDITSAPAHSAPGVTSFFFRDPAGSTLEIQHFERLDWPTPGR